MNILQPCHPLPNTPIKNIIAEISIDCPSIYEPGFAKARRNLANKRLIISNFCLPSIMKNKIINLKENINKEENPLRLKSGCASGVPDFFDKIIKKQFANKESIREIHKTLLQYVNGEKAVFIIRLYGSDSKKIYNNLRRGFLTIYPTAVGWFSATTHLQCPLPH